VIHIREKDQKDAPLAHEFIAIKLSSTCLEKVINVSYQ